MYSFAVQVVHSRGPARCANAQTRSLTTSFVRATATGHARISVGTPVGWCVGTIMQKESTQIVDV